MALIAAACKPIMIDLPTEILREILSYLSGSLVDLSQVSRCSRYLNSIAGPLLYKDFHLSLCLPKENEIAASITALEGLASDKGWGGYVQTFTVSGMDSFAKWDPEYSSDIMKKIYMGMISALVKMPKLKMFSWRIQSQFPAPEVIGILSMLSAGASLKDINLGFERDNDDLPYRLPAGGDNICRIDGLAKLAIGCRGPTARTIEILQSMIEYSSNVKVLRISGELCVKLFPDARLVPPRPPPQLGRIKPTILEISSPYENYTPNVFAAGIIDVQSCTSLTFDWGGDVYGWFQRMNIPETLKTQPKFLSRLKVLRFVDCDDNEDGFGASRFLRGLSGLEEISFIGCRLDNPYGEEGSSLGFLRTHAQSLRKLFLPTYTDEVDFLDSILEFRNLEDVGIGMPYPLLGVNQEVEGATWGLERLMNAPKLQTFRIVIASEDAGNVTHVLDLIERQVVKLFKWPSLRFLCVLDGNSRWFAVDEVEIGERWEVFMMVWERVRLSNGGMRWDGPVKVSGRVLATELSRGTGLARYDDWDEWLRKKYAESCAQSLGDA